MDHVGSLLLGLGNGAVFAALALALVLTYRSSGVINFATGAIAMFSAYTYASLRKGEMLLFLPGLPKSAKLGTTLGLYPAAAISLALTALLGALLYLVVFRPLRDRPPLARAVASLGVMIVIQGTVAIAVGTAPVAVKAIFPTKRWEWGSLALISDRFYLAVVITIVTIAITLVFRYTRFGLFTRASAESQTGAFVSGVSPDRIALVNWMISAAVAGLAGILIAPISPVTPISYTLFVIPALAAALVGSFQHLIPTVLAGFAIGMLQGEALNLANKYSWMPQTGASELVPLLVILVVLTVTGQGIQARGGLLRLPLGRAPRPRSVLFPALVGLAVGGAALALTSGTWRNAVIGSFIAAVIALSFVVVTGYAGQVSLAQLALAGAGGYTLSYITVGWGIPFPFAPLLAALFATAIGVVVGLPALRLRGLTLGVVTLAFAWAIEAAWFRNTQIVDAAGASVESPSLFGMELGPGTGKEFPRIGFGLVCLIALVLVGMGVAYLRRSSLGSAMLAVRANERSASGLGVNVTRVKVLSFAIASFIAGIGGCMLAYSRGTITYDSFLAVSGLVLLSTAYLAGVTSVWGGVLAGIMAASGIAFFAIDKWIHLGDWFAVIMGIALILTLITNPEGLAAGGHSLAARLPLPLFGRNKTEAAAFEPAPVVEIPADAEPILQVRGLDVRYGGVVAVDGVSIQVRPGSVVGLIGPNGAGKTSVIDAITGFAQSTGAIEISGGSLDGLAPHARVKKGLVRTFQALELYDDLSVEENVSVAAFASSVSERPATVSRALALVGIEELRDRPAGDLSQGQRQLVSIARACAAQPSVLLLDEPAAGLDSGESRWLGERIRAVADTGTGVLLVDHDVALVLGLCDYVYVLDFGRLIAEGDPATIRADRGVAEAYLGTSHEEGGDRDVPEPALDAFPSAVTTEVSE